MVAGKAVTTKPVRALPPARPIRRATMMRIVDGTSRWITVATWDWFSCLILFRQSCT